MVRAELVAASPEECGVDAAALEALFKRAEEELTRGGLEGCQVAIARHGKLAGVRSFGTVNGGEPCTDDTMFVIFSATKSISSVAMWQLLEQGKLNLDQRVGDLIPEFAQSGKHEVTIRQVMTMTAGFPNPTAPSGAFANLIRPEFMGNSAARREQFATWTLDWEPGAEYLYHPLSAHWVMMELLETVTGQDFREYIREHVIEPMGLTELYVGLFDETKRDRVAEVVVNEANLKEFEAMTAAMFKAQGREVDPERLAKAVSANARGFTNWNGAEQRALGAPAGGCVTTAAELAMFFQPLVSPEGRGYGEIVKPETIAWATRSHTEPWRHVEHFPTPESPDSYPVNRGLGLSATSEGTFTSSDGRVLPLTAMNGFGHNASTRAFGHGGAGGQIGWGDPETGISIGFVTNTFTDSISMGKRTVALSSMASACAAELGASSKL